MEQMIPCEGHWYAVVLATTLNGQVVLTLSRVFAWKYIQDSDEEYTPVEPYIWAANRAGSAQSIVGFRGCVSRNDLMGFARLLSEPDIDEIPEFMLGMACSELGLLQDEVAVEREKFQAVRKRQEEEKKK